MSSSTTLQLGKHTVIARDEVTGKYERIHISRTTRKLFKDVGKPRHYPHPKTKPVTYFVDLEYRAEKYAEFEEEIKNKALISRLLTLRERLEISQQARPSLEERLELPPIDLPKLPLEREELPQFKKTKILKRQNEYYTMFEATAKRLQQLHPTLMKEMAKAYEEVPVSTEKLQRYQDVGQLFKRFDRVNKAFEEDYQGKLTHSQ